MTLFFKTYLSFTPKLLLSLLLFFVFSGCNKTKNTFSNTQQSTIKTSGKTNLNGASSAVWSLSSQSSKNLGTALAVAPRQFITTFQVLKNLQSQEDFEQIILSHTKQQNLNFKKVLKADPVLDLVLFESQTSTNSYLDISDLKDSKNSSQEVFITTYVNGQLKQAQKMGPQTEDSLLYSFASNVSNWQGGMGSPVFNPEGQLIALTIHNDTNIIFALKSSYLQNFMANAPNNCSGLDINSCVKKSTEFLKTKASEGDEALAHYNLARLLNENPLVFNEAVFQEIKNTMNTAQKNSLLSHLATTERAKMYLLKDNKNKEDFNMARSLLESVSQNRAFAPALYELANLSNKTSLLKKAAHQFYAPAMYELGTMSDESSLSLLPLKTKDRDEALNWLKRATKVAYLPAHVELSALYGEEGPYKDSNKSLQHLFFAANAGHPLSQLELGDKYYLGVGLTQDPKESFYWRKKAADQNLVEAQAKIGDMYLFGDGTNQDDDQALFYFKQASDQGLYTTATLIGYLNGSFNITLEQRLKEFYFNFYILKFLLPEGSLDLNFQPAIDTIERFLPKKELSVFQEELGLRFSITGSTEEAKTWLKKAIKNGSSSAIYYLINLSNPLESLSLLQQAVEQGVDKAQNDLGQNYLIGSNGFEKDYKKAESLFQKAIKQNYFPSHYSLGEMYFRGLVKRDLKQAYRHFLLFKDLIEVIPQDPFTEDEFLYANQKTDTYIHHIESVLSEKDILTLHNEMAIKYFNGLEGLNQNYDKATEWFKKPAESDFVDIKTLAQYYLATISLNELGTYAQDPKTALIAIKEAAKKGIAPAQYTLGQIYETGLTNILEPDLTQSVDLIQKAASANHAPALYKLGIMYRNGVTKKDTVILKPDLTQFVDLIQKAASANHAPALYELGILYRDGVTKKDTVVLKPDLTQFVDLIQKAASANHAPALYELGLLYRDGVKASDTNEELIKANLYLAIKNFQQAKALNSVPAQYELGVLQANGLKIANDIILIRQNIPLATQNIKHAAEAGHGPAKYELGVLYQQTENPVSTQQDPKTSSLYWITQAGKDGYHPALIHLGIKHAEGHQVEQNNNKAIGFFNQVIEDTTSNSTHKAQAYFYLGKLYQELGDLTQAYIHLNIAEALDDSNSHVDPFEIYSLLTEIESHISMDNRRIALNSLGKTYIEGKKVTQDYNKAMKWFKLSATAKDPSAHFYLGQMFLRLKKDLPQAYIHLQIAKESQKYKNHPELNDMLQEIETRLTDTDLLTSHIEVGLRYTTGDGLEQNYSKAVEWLKSPANHGIAEAQYHLGIILLDNHPGLKKDPLLAESYLKQAADIENYGPAQFSLGVIYWYGATDENNTIIIEQNKLLAYYYMVLAEYNEVTEGLVNGQIEERTKIMKIIESGSSEHIITTAKDNAGTTYQRLISQKKELN